MTSELPKAEAGLRALLARYATANSKRQPLLEADVRLLADSLVAAQPRSTHSLAYLILSKIASEPSEHGTLRDAIATHIESVFLQDTEDDIDPLKLVPFTSLVAALFPLEPASSKTLLEHRLSISTDDKVVDDPLAVLLEAAELPSPLQLAVADMLAQASGTKAGRELVRSRATEWLRGASEVGDNETLAAVCAVALSKLGQEVIPGQEGVGEEEVMGLCDKMLSALKAGGDQTAATMTSVEGLAILSTRSAVKIRLANDQAFLKALVDLCPIPRPRGGSLPITPRASMEIPMEYVPADAGLCYGITTILVNLTSPKPILSAEDEQVAKLRAMAISGKRDTSEVAQDDPADEPESVRQRVKAVYTAGGVKALTGLIRADSRTVKEGLGKLCLNLVESKEDRLVFVRDGGFKVLSTLIRDLAPTTTATSKPSAAKVSVAAAKASDTGSFLHAAQALAKLVITTTPNLLFPPPLTTSCLDALAPLYHCLSDPSSTLLQQFESLMALTNLASIEPSIASRIVEATITPEQGSSGMWRGTGRDDQVRVLHKVEESLISDNILVRRAASELICNLVSSQRGFEEFTNKQSGRTESRLKLLLILTNSDDLPTRLATGGALAILTESPHACACLLRDQDRSVWTRVLGMCIPQDTDEEGESIPVISSDVPDEASLHRAAVILHNLVVHIAGLGEEERKKQFRRLRQDEVESTLMSLITKRIDRAALEPVVECLKVIRKHPT